MKLLAILSLPGYVTVWGFLQLFLLRGKRKGRATRRSEPPSFAVLLAISQVLLAIALLRMSSVSISDHLIIRLVGVSIVAAGIALSAWAQIAMGKNWFGGVGLRKGHTLVTSGPYTFVRHPMYAGMFISGIGICFVSLDWLYGLASLLLVAAVASRIFAEEELLRTKFKRQYEEYTQATGALWPKLRRRR